MTPVQFLFRVFIQFGGIRHVAMGKYERCKRHFDNDDRNHNNSNDNDINITIIC